MATRQWGEKYQRKSGLTYPRVYHLACNHLVAFGGHGGDTVRGRKLVADALRAIRHQFGRGRAQQERRHMLFISGQFPVKARS